MHFQIKTKYNIVKICHLGTLMKNTKSIDDASEDVLRTARLVIRLAELNNILHDMMAFQTSDHKSNTEKQCQKNQLIIDINNFRKNNND